MSEFDITPEDLILPVYLNQRVVFDMVAMMQEGIATVTRVSETETASTEEASRIKGSFGLSDALGSLLKVGLSGSGKSRKERGGERTRDEERVHTPASLVQTLRSELWKKNLITSFDPDDPPEPGDIIELEGYLRRNPVLRTIDVYIEMMDYAVIFGDEDNGNVDYDPTESAALKRQMESFFDKLVAGGTVDIVTDELGGGYSAVLTLEEQFLNDPSMSDLVDGHFRVFGKVVKSIGDSSDSISLIRKSALSILEEKSLRTVFSTLEQEPDQSGEDIQFRIPPIQWVVKGPVIQMLPICIFS